MKAIKKVIGYIITSLKEVNNELLDLFKYKLLSGIFVYGFFSILGIYYLYLVELDFSNRSFFLMQ